MILGVGLDLVAVDRVTHMLERYGDRLLSRCFDPAELLRPGDPEHLAGLLAAKEAAFKALGTPRGSGIGWRHLLVLRDGPGGPPRLHLLGPAAERAAELGAEALHLSITHHGGFAAAVVILERRPDPGPWSGSR